MSFLFQQFKQRGYTDPSFDRRAATTTGQMQHQVVDSPIDVFATASSTSNRQLPVNEKRTIQRRFRTISIVLFRILPIDSPNMTIEI